MFLAESSDVYAAFVAPLRARSSLLDDAYRVAVCLGADDRLAMLIAAIALRGERVSATGEVRERVRIRILRKVLAEARLALPSTSTSPPAAALPELFLLSLPEREVLVLELVCDLPPAAIGEAVGVPVAAVRGMRRSARQTLARHRCDG
jgi:hypothetical protein